MDKFKIIENGSITTVSGFLAGAVSADIKGNGKNRDDMTALYSEDSCSSAGVYTTNKVRSQTVDISKEHIDKDNLRAIVVNSGNANACVGRKGYEAALKMTELMAGELELEREQVAVASTGVIGVPLPMDRVESGIKKLKATLSKDGGIDFAKAIMTTDLVKKNIAIEFELDGGEKVVIGGVVKGSGMIHPNMATMLGFVTTDVSISSEILKDIVRDVTKRTFNRISVDRDTSTNDMVIAMANGRAKNRKIESKDVDCQIFKEAFYYVMEYLAKSIARDGEGATKLLEVEVRNAFSEDDAVLVGKAVITSPLVKTALFGEDPNWGRIIAAIGYSGAEVSEGELDISINGIKICENGIGILNDEKEISESLKNSEIKVLIDMKIAEGDAKTWGCDLSYDYIKINADYRS